MKRIFTTAALMILILALAAPLMAQPGPAGNRPRHRANREFNLGRALNDQNLRTRLNITDEQVAKLKAAFLEAAKAGIKEHADLKIKRLELASLMSGDKVDHAQVNQKITEISALQASLLKNRIATQLAVKETLTADQLSKLKMWRQAQAHRFMQERMQQRMGMMPRMGQPGQGPRGPRGPQASPAPAAPPKPGDDGQ
ncbi:MAG: periplasmic heavy metal sensor [Acidobacteriia bacterium]|nr:periplasmic heavy metal sensor [Terriglobia bacterium]